ncbi:MAG TPA: hypothetical protein VIY72_12805, partial [Acidimicrobiales bacterium]
MTLTLDRPDPRRHRRRAKLTTAVVVVMALALVGSACSSGGSDGGDGGDGGAAPVSTDRQAAVTEVVVDVLEPNLRSAAAAADAAVRAVTDYCAAPTAE